MEVDATRVGIMMGEKKKKRISVHRPREQFETRERCSGITRGHNSPRGKSGKVCHG